MVEQLLPYVLILLVIGLVWFLINLLLKLTVKIFSCGCLVLLVIAVIVFLLGGDIPIF
jgi:hypothetical protein